MYHQYADDIQLYTAITSMSDSIMNLYACADAVTTWHIQNDLLLNPTKMEALVTGTREQVTKINQSAGIMVTSANVPFVNKIRVMGATIDSELSFDDHITSVVRACNFHIQAMRHIRHLLNQDAANTIACSIVCSRLDYCSTVVLQYCRRRWTVSRLCKGRGINLYCYCCYCYCTLWRDGAQNQSPSAHSEQSSSSRM